MAEYGFKEFVMEIANSKNYSLKMLLQNHFQMKIQEEYICADETQVSRVLIPVFWREILAMRRT